MLASANMLAPKRPVKSCLGVETLCLASRCSAVRTAVHEIIVQGARRRKPVFVSVPKYRIGEFHELAITTSTFETLFMKRKRDSLHNSNVQGPQRPE